MDISVIIVNWRSARYLHECLCSLRSALVGLHSEVIVIDNASFDGSDKTTAECFPEATFIQSQNNLGFAGANNAASAKAVGRMLLFLNPDTKCAPEALRVLFSALDQNESAAIAGPRVLNGDGTVQTSCVQAFPRVLNQILDAECLRRLWPRSALWGVKALHGESVEPTKVEAVAGSCLLIRRAIFGRLGGFDTRYFMYAEDLDLCKRATDLGFCCLHVPQSVIVHYGGGSSSLAGSDFSIIAMRDAVYKFIRTHQGAGASVAYRALLAFSALLRIALALLILPFRRARAVYTFRKWWAIIRWSIGVARARVQ